MENEKRVIALGFFDGVHLGHGALLRRVRERADELGAVPAACTFDTHPENLILQSPTPLLSTPADRAWLMRQYYGIQDVIIAPFDDHMMHMPWRDFVTDFLVAGSSAVHLVAGHDFHFGYKGEGNPQRLEALCQELGLGCDIVPKVERDHITISSTYIRTLVAQGELARAAEFLGHPYAVTVEPIPGGGPGEQLLGLPAGVLLPPPGTYACQFLNDGQTWDTQVTLTPDAPRAHRAACPALPIPAAPLPLLFLDLLFLERKSRQKELS